MGLRQTALCVEAGNAAREEHVATDDGVRDEVVLGAVVESGALQVDGCGRHRGLSSSNLLT